MTGCVSASRTSGAFNRTIVELKQNIVFQSLQGGGGVDTFNRTIVELKLYLTSLVKIERKIF